MSSAFACPEGHGEPDGGTLAGWDVDEGLPVTRRVGPRANRESARREGHRQGAVLTAELGDVGVLALGGQPEVWRLSDDPFSTAFWQSHYWGGAGLTGLLLFSLAAQPEIRRNLRWRLLHVSANALATLLFLAQVISGSRDLLEIPLSWQKPAIQSCDYSAQVCPSPAPVPAPAEASPPAF